MDKIFNYLWDKIRIRTLCATQENYAQFGGSTYHDSFSVGCYDNWFIYGVQTDRLVGSL